MWKPKVCKHEKEVLFSDLFPPISKEKLNEDWKQHANFRLSLPILLLFVHLFLVFSNIASILALCDCKYVRPHLLNNKYIHLHSKSNHSPLIWLHVFFYDPRIGDVIDEDVVHSRAPFVTCTQQCFAIKAGIDGLLDVARRSFCDTSEGVYRFHVCFLILPNTADWHNAFFSHT